MIASRRATVHTETGTCEPVGKTFATAWKIIRIAKTIEHVIKVISKATESMVNEVIASYTGETTAATEGISRLAGTTGAAAEEIYAGPETTGVTAKESSGVTAETDATTEEISGVTISLALIIKRNSGHIMDPAGITSDMMHGGHTTKSVTSPDMAGTSIQSEPTGKAG